MRTVHNEQAERIFPRLRAALVKNDMFDQMEPTDEAYLNDVLGALLVTGPIDDGNPFSVETDRAFERARPAGKSFEVYAAKVSPHNNMYIVHFVAVSDEYGFVYEFKGRIRNTHPALLVETAEVREVDGHPSIPFE